MYVCVCVFVFFGWGHEEHSRGALAREQMRTWSSAQEAQLVRECGRRPGRAPVQPPSKQEEEDRMSFTMYLFAPDGGVCVEEEGQMVADEILATDAEVHGVPESSTRKGREKHRVLACIAKGCDLVYICVWRKPPDPIGRAGGRSTNKSTWLMRSRLAQSRRNQSCALPKADAQKKTATHQ